MEIINIIAIILSPIVAVLVSDLANTKKEIREDKKQIFSTLVVYQYYITDQNRTNSLNLIPFVFGKSKDVLLQFQHYSKCHNDLKHLVIMGTNENLSLKFVELQKSYTRLLECMAKDLKYDKEFRWDKITESIIPQKYVDEKHGEQWF